MSLTHLAHSHMMRGRAERKNMLAVCPKCDVGLFVVRFKSVEVDYCERCRGVWLDTGEVERLMEATGAEPSDPLRRFPTHPATSLSPERHLCPRCDARLEELIVDGPADGTAGSEGRTSQSKSTSGNLTLDRCPRGHGLWFDADELQQLLSFYPAESSASRTIAYLNELFGKRSNT